MTRISAVSAIAAAAFAGAIASVVLLLPPRALPGPATPRPASRPVVGGAFHVHTTRSDGAATVDDVAAAAARAHLQFVVITDHGDATRAPDPPSYRSGVLVLDGVEISAAGGHYAVVGLPQAPYPLAGELRDVVEDVSRLGGFGVAGHGDSPKPDLAWHDWNVPFDGIEWLSLDSEWRRRTRTQLARAFASYFLRPPEALASLMSRPVELLARWDAATQKRRVVSLAATDAHTRTMPSYEAMFSTLITRVEVEAPFGGQAETDARVLVSALRQGRHYTLLNALAAPGGLSFKAVRGTVDTYQGDGVSAGDPVAFDATADAPDGARIVLLRDGESIAESDKGRVTYITDGRRATYRVEVRVPNAPGDPPVPWIVSNPIYVGIPSGDASRQSADDPGAAASGRPPRPGPFRSGITRWAAEHDASSTAMVSGGEPPGNGEIALQFALGPGRPLNQFAALAGAVDSGLANADRLTFTARASRPMRIDVQLRPSGPDPTRWQRSVYLDQSPRTVTVFFNDLRPLPRDAAGTLPIDAVGAVLFVVDTNNTPPSTSGVVHISDFRFQSSEFSVQNSKF